MAVLKLRNVEQWKDARNGRWRFYFRKGKGKRIPLPGLPGSAEFMAGYAQASKGGNGRVNEQARSLDALITLYLKSPNFLRQAEESQYSTRNVMERIREAHGKGSVPQMNRLHVEAIISEKADTPSAANNWLKRLRTLINYSIALGWRQTDPTKGIKKFKEGEYHTWTEDELLQFEKRWAIGTRERTAYALALFTGQRRADVSRMAWTDISGRLVKVKQAKTGTKLSIPMHAKLRAALAGWPRSSNAVVTNSYGRQYTVESFGNLMADAIRKAKLPERCVFHGLRKAAARRLAEAGCTPHQIAAITGHKSLEEIERYTRACAQAQMAEDAMAKLEGVGEVENKQKKTKSKNPQRRRLSA